MKKFWAIGRLLAVVLLSVVLVSGLTTPTAAAPGILQGDYQFPANLDVLDPNQVLELVNAERATLNLQPLKADRELGLVAAARAQDMATRQYYAHKNPDGVYFYDLFDSYGVDAGFACENLDMVFVPSKERVVEEWRASLRGHRACMMHTKTTHAGYAATTLTLVDFEGQETTAYLVVAIHAEFL